MLWSSIALLATIIHDTQSTLEESNLANGMLRSAVDKDLRKYVDQKLMSSMVLSTLKAKMTQELTQYVEHKVAAEMAGMSSKVKQLKMDVYGTWNKSQLGFGRMF
jgi:ABC-type transporter MlaC component